MKATTLKVKPKPPKRPEASRGTQSRNPPPEELLMQRNKFDDSAAAEEEEGYF